ncbi:MAG: hypothetical protein ACI845_000596 [Gammaproteobacteria bacterium]|jgi:hypothetical protein
MNITLDHFAEDNPVIDELVENPPRSRKVISLRASNPIFRKPFIEIELDNGQLIQRHFMKADFAKYWAEAVVILETITTIRVESDFAYTPVSDRENLEQQVLDQRESSISECNEIFGHGWYKVYLQQFGRDCKKLPAETIRNIQKAMQEMKHMESES